MRVTEPGQPGPGICRYNALVVRFKGFQGLLIGLAALGLVAADKKLPIEQTSNDLVEISAALLDKDQVHQELGAELGPDFIVVRTTFRPVSDKPIAIDLDDFVLVSTKDGARCQAFAPSQIAGSAALVVTPQGTKSVGKTRPTFGLGGMIGMGAGTVGSEPDPANTKVEATHSDTDSPLLASLTTKVLPQKEVTESVSGLLYFELSGAAKLKSKDLELHYKGPGGRLALRFRL